MTEAKMGRAASFGEPWTVDDFKSAKGIPVQIKSRLVVCSNALAGIPDPAEYRAAVDALREAAKSVVSHIDMPTSIPFEDLTTEDEWIKAVSNLRAALARLESNGGGD